MIDMNLPPAVVEFAQKNNCEELSLNKFWNAEISKKQNGYAVYNARCADKGTAPWFIIEKSGDIRFATTEEWKKLIDVYF